MQFSTIVLAALSLGSAIASPVGGFAPFNSAASKVANVKLIVGQEANRINSWASGVPNANTIASVKKSLVTIRSNMNQLVETVSPLESAAKDSLSKEQIASVKQFQNDIKDIFVNLESVGNSVTNSNFDKTALSQFNPDLQSALTSAPLVSANVLAFINLAAPSYATYSYWYPSLIQIDALISIIINLNLKIYIGLGIYL
ncbi:hypothetical protein NPX13_g8573 [Xylaria arbuscula]|uniref:Uncharacterized protein n=1 Tax=Xylaria arbuscula TaxID=114810 RepID=A0A9W8N8B7_9PEZI|nr:hypothetical protein NPX13_g8573 [Xylaria arbuscula]